MFFKKPKPEGPVDWMIVGLGNPGKQYEGTRHNAGFMVLEALSKKLGVRVGTIRFKSYCGRGRIGGREVLLLTPQTFMNNSGEAVREAMRFYKIPPERTIVVFDDISLSPGTIRVRRQGSDGGQKGMRSIIALTGSDQYPRVKVGIGDKPHPDYELADWVLSRFRPEEARAMLEAVERAAEAVCTIVTEDIDTAMSRYSH
jgi:PTH1 family peptidyl-tRNA hydrolase